MENLAPRWYTIHEFANVRPVNLYHKEGLQGPKEPTGKRNLHVLARSELNYSKDQGAVRLRITADDYYKLYVNGALAAQGPAPAYPEKYYYNELDITPHLSEGKNILAVHLYYQGLLNRVWNSADGRFALASQILYEKGDKKEPLWKYWVSNAFSGDIIAYETQYLENFNSNLWDENWNLPEFDDSFWPKMTLASWADYNLVKQPTDLLAVYEIEPEEVIKQGNLWRVDMGREITGALFIEAIGAKGSKVIIRCGEELNDDGSVRYDMRCNCLYEEVWTLKDGRSVLTPYDYKAFRYGELILGDGVEILTLKAQVRHYPMDESLCRLESNAKYLKEIFEICKNGVRCGTQDGFLDCPTREKGQYLGDAVVTARSHLWLTGKTDMLRKCVDQFALTTKLICPGMMAVAPGSFMQEIADFSLLWPELLLTDYQFTGDKEFLRAYYPAAKGIIDHFEGFERADGLLESVTDKWNLVDWPQNLRDDYDFELSRKVAPGCHNVINAIYAGAVKNLTQIEQILEIEISHDFERLKKAYIAAFFDEKKGLFKDHEKSSHTALHSNIYAIYFGLYPEGKEGKIADFMLEKGLSCGVMLSYFYLKALSRAGRKEDAYRVIVNESERGWVNMLREGATSCFEAWGKDQKWNTSLCHPWASAPISLLIEDIAGIVPDPEIEAGIRFEPHIPADVKEIELAVPFRGKKYIVRKKDGEITFLCEELC
ncbi:MAG: family 78 glycoside hydrolase catalytic domain [Christensenellales bacterium]|jgi:alpha-L-rhamnosidase